MGKNREKILKALKSIHEEFIVREAATEMYQPFRIFTKDGGAIAYVTIEPIDGPYLFSDEEYKEALELINENELRFLESFYGDDCDIDIIQMIGANCKPNTEYYRFRMDESDEPKFSEDYDELESALFFELEPIDDYKPWDKMDDAELEEWHWWLEVHLDGGSLPLPCSLK
ncbi:hypothetical protein ACFL36_04445 [Thermodesulfobacteriota bacterium]